MQHLRDGAWNVSGRLGLNFLNLSCGYERELGMAAIELSARALYRCRNDSAERKFAAGRCFNHASSLYPEHAGNVMPG